MIKTLLKTLILGSLVLSPLSAFADNNDGKSRPAKGKMLKRMDLDSDGEVSKEEFLAGSEKKFSKIDTNEDGKITKEEIKAHREKKRALKGEKKKGKETEK